MAILQFKHAIAAGVNSVDHWLPPRILVLRDERSSGDNWRIFSFSTESRSARSGEFKQSTMSKLQSISTSPASFVSCIWCLFIRNAIGLASIGSTGLVYFSLTWRGSSGTGAVLKVNRGSTSCPLSTASTRTELVFATKTLPLQYLKNNDQLVLHKSNSMWSKA